MWRIVAGKIDFTEGKQYDTINDVNTKLRQMMDNTDSFLSFESSFLCWVSVNYNTDWNSLFLQPFSWTFVTVTILPNRLQSIQKNAIVIDS